MNKDFAFILGNGITRLEIDCEGLLDYGTVFGCNRIYEEFAPSVLVSTDADMAKEIQQSGYSAKHIHYTRNIHLIKDSGAQVLPKHIHGYSSGPAALGLAAQTDAIYLCMIGMDLKGVNNMINNIYAGTPYYKPKNTEPMYYGNWIDQLDTLFKLHTDKRFIQVNPLNNWTADQLHKNANFQTMTLDEFSQMINNS